MAEKRVIVEAKNLCKYFSLDSGKQEQVKAVDNFSFTIHEGETYGLVGESGCGKSTLGRCLLRLLEPTSGEVRILGQNFLGLKGNALRQMRRQAQMVFQDPYMSLDPKMRVGQILMEALAIHQLGNQEERFAWALEMMQKMGFQAEHFFRFPHEFSGGQRQRIGLARALLLQAKFIVCDEPVSALDVSVQAQIINMLKDIQQETNVAYLFITHNLNVVRYISDRIGVMYLGNLVEEAPTEELFSHIQHPYTEALLSAIPSPNPHVINQPIELKGDVPSPLNVPAGCVFCSRCPHAQEQCRQQRPALKAIPGREQHKVACWFPLQKE